MKGDNIEKVPSTPSSERKSFREEVATVTVDNAKEDLHFSSTSVQHRKLESFHINLISIGGTVGTALFIYMGSGKQFKASLLVREMLTIGRQA